MLLQATRHNVVLDSGDRFVINFEGHDSYLTYRIHQQTLDLYCAYVPELSLEEGKAERDDAWDYAITGIENFKDSKGKIITCTRENKLALMKVPVFDRLVARCLQILASSGVKEKEEHQ